MSITFTEMENRARAALFAAGYSSSEITNEMILDKLRELFGQMPGQPTTAPPSEEEARQRALRFLEQQKREDDGLLDELIKLATDQTSLKPTADDPRRFDPEITGQYSNG